MAQTERASSSAQKVAQPVGANLPRRVGAYTLFDFIGRGGMAEIYLARVHTDLGAVRLCVVKEILPEFAEQKEFADMLSVEAKLAARLSHANVVQVFDLGMSDGHLFIAMEYVEGLDLNALLRRCTQGKIALPIEFAIGIVCEALRGLDYAHRRTDDEGKPLGIVHRDVSPSNLLVSFDGQVKLCDFGIARANDVVEEAPVSDESIKGKAGYMSPEQATGGPIDARADVFSAGILLWELVSGRCMYKPSSDVPLLEQARRVEIKSPENKGIPEQAELNRIIMRALSKDRDARQASAGELLTELEDYMAKAKLMMSPLRLGEWMEKNFGTEITAQRRAREQALSAQSLPSMRTERAPASAPPPSGESAVEPAKLEEIYGPSSLVAATVDLKDAPSGRELAEDRGPPRESRIRKEEEARPVFRGPPRDRDHRAPRALASLVKPVARVSLVKLVKP